MKKNSPATNGQIRIIGGQWRGRRLPVPDSPGLRPTTDRIRETLFNWLTPWIANARCLDCFAGSGALGFEALSRGAAQVTSLESERHIVRQLEKNLLLLAETRVQVIHTDTLAYLSRPSQAQDIVFVDPPFRQTLLANTLNLLETQGWLAEQALIYVECEREHGLPVTPARWQLLREKTAGQVAYRLYSRQPR